MSYYWANSKRFQDQAEVKEEIPVELYADYMDEPTVGGKRKHPDGKMTDYDTGRSGLANVDRMIAQAQLAGAQADPSKQRSKEVVGGVTALAARYGQGDENSASRRKERHRREEETQQGEFSLPKGRTREDFDFKSTGTETGASVDKKLTASTSLGFKMMQMMGWKEDTGLGKNAQGIVNPVKMGTMGSRMGIGKEAEAEETGSEATANRKLHKTEIHYFATPEEKAAKLKEAERNAVIKEDVQKQTQKFFCNACKKQYKTLQDWDDHINSTAHHHRARMIETRRQHNNMLRTEEDDEANSRKQDKALARMRKAALKAEKAEAKRKKLAAAAKPLSTNTSNSKPGFSMSMGKPKIGFSMGKSKKSSGIKFSFSGKK